MSILKFAVIFKVFFLQIIKRRKIDSLESDRSGFAKYLPYELDLHHIVTPSSLIYRMEIVPLSHR